jgi:ABC-type glycerol-3-phosphate transport system substrate-binding protein
MAQLAIDCPDAARDGARRRRTRFGAAAAALVALVGTLAACGGGDDSGKKGNASKATLTFVNAQDPGTFDKLIAAFNKANPNIKIKLQTVPFDTLNSTVQSRVGSKDASIDLYEVDEPRLAAFASRGYLLDLADLKSQAGSKIDPKAMAATQYQGKQYAMPRWTSTQLLYYNKAILQKANITPPSSDPTKPITWEQLATDAKKAQTAGGARWGFTFEQVDRYYQLQPLPESAGGGSGVSGPKKLTPDVSNAGWIKAFDWYASTFKSGISPRGVSPEQTEPLFAGGNTAFFAGGPWNASLLDKAKGLDYGVAPEPMFAGGKPASSTGSWSVGISPFSKNQAAAKKFLSFMTIDPNGAWQASSRNIPVQSNAFNKYLTEMQSEGANGGQIAAIIRNELAHNATARPTTVGFVDFETVMNKAFADIRNGSDPAKRLQQASGELKRAFAKYS